MANINISNFLTDPLSDITRKERRNLLLTSTIGILVVKMGLIPTHIAALGIELTVPNQEVFPKLVGFIVTYFLFAFVNCGLSDFFIWRKKLQDYLVSANVSAITRTEQDEFFDDEAHQGIARARWLYTMSPNIAYFRIFFEFVVPIIVSIYAIYILMHKSF